MIKPRYYKWVILGVLALILVAYFVPLEIITTLDQKNEATTTGYVQMDATSIANYPIVGQGFQMSSVSGHIKKVGFYAVRSGNVAGTVKVQLWRDNGLSPFGPETLLLEKLIYPTDISTTLSWVEVTVDITYVSVTPMFLVIDFGSSAFLSGAYIRVYYSNSAYRASSDTLSVWSVLWKASPSHSWTPDLAKDMLFRAYRGTVRCWKCDNYEPVSKDFGYSVTCGSGEASDYPYSTQQDCGTPPPNHPPTCDSILGPTQGVVNTEYSFTVTANDIDGDALQYYADWGDGTNSGWKTTNSLTKIYTTNGEFYIKAKVKDSHGSESTYCPSTIILIGKINVYTVSFTSYDKTSAQILPDVTVTFNSITKKTDVNGNALFENINAGTIQLTASKTDYKQFSSPLIINSNKTMYICMAPSSSNSTSSLSETPPVPPNPEPEPLDYYTILIMLIIGIVLTALSVLFVRRPMKIGAIFIIWIIIGIIYLLYYGGVF